MPSCWGLWPRGGRGLRSISAGLAQGLCSGHTFFPPRDAGWGKNPLFLAPLCFPGRLHGWDGFWRKEPCAGLGSIRRGRSKPPPRRAVSSPWDTERGHGPSRRSWPEGGLTSLFIPPGRNGTAGGSPASRSEAEQLFEGLLFSFPRTKCPRTWRVPRAGPEPVPDPRFRALCWAGRAGSGWEGGSGGLSHRKPSGEMEVARMGSTSREEQGGNRYQPKYR